jgi:hypothetical protein
MKFDHFISKQLQSSDAFVANSYELSRLLVLNHAFFVVGTGLEISDCGLYITQPEWREGGKMPSLPYGEEKTPTPPKGYFNNRRERLFCPYPIFKKHSVAAIIAENKTNMAEDWMSGLRDVSQEAIKYFGSESRCAGHPYRKTEGWEVFVKEQKELLLSFIALCE